MQDTGHAWAISCSFLGVSEPAVHMIIAETEVPYLVVGAQLYRSPERTMSQQVLAAIVN